MSLKCVSMSPYLLQHRKDKTGTAHNHKVVRVNMVR